MDDFVKQSITDLYLDRSDWELVTFGDVAIQQKETVDRENTSLTRYVKGEHMGSEDLHLREWGELQDEYLGPAFIRKFESGDILYGSRRTYLRKVAIAPFEGITSNTTFVIKANEKKIDKRLLPFVMLSEGFSQHSIRNSKGSVNPYVNWKDIANYEFLLPPIRKQIEIADLLCRMDYVIETSLRLREKLNLQLSSVLREYFNGNNENKFLSEFVEKTISGGTPDTKKRHYYVNGTIPWVTTTSICGDLITNGEKYITDTAVKESSAKKLPEWNILAGTRVGVGKFAINFKEISFSQDVTGLIVNDDIDLEFLLYQLQSTRIQSKLLAKARGTTIKGVTKEDLLRLQLFVPDRKAQLAIRNKVKSLKSSIINSESRVNNSQQLHKSLIMQVF